MENISSAVDFLQKAASLLDDGSTISPEDLDNIVDMATAILYNDDYRAHHDKADYVLTKASLRTDQSLLDGATRENPILPVELERIKDTTINYLQDNDYLALHELAATVSIQARYELALGEFNSRKYGEALQELLGAMKLIPTARSSIDQSMMAKLYFLRGEAFYFCHQYSQANIAFKIAQRYAQDSDAQEGSDLKQECDSRLQDIRTIQSASISDPSSITSANEDSSTALSGGTATADTGRIGMVESVSHGDGDDANDLSMESLELGARPLLLAYTTGGDILSAFEGMDNAFKRTFLKAIATALSIRAEDTATAPVEDVAMASVEDAKHAGGSGDTDFDMNKDGDDSKETESIGETVGDAAEAPGLFRPNYGDDDDEYGSDDDECGSDDEADEEADDKVPFMSKSADDLGIDLVIYGDEDAAKNATPPTNAELEKAIIDLKKEKVLIEKELVDEVDGVERMNLEYSLDVVDKEIDIHEEALSRDHQNRISLVLATVGKCANHDISQARGVGDLKNTYIRFCHEAGKVLGSHVSAMHVNVVDKCPGTTSRGHCPNPTVEQKAAFLNGLERGTKHSVITHVGVAYGGDVSNMEATRLVRIPGNKFVCAFAQSVHLQHGSVRRVPEPYLTEKHQTMAFSEFVIMLDAFYTAIGATDPLALMKAICRPVNYFPYAVESPREQIEYTDEDVAQRDAMQEWRRKKREAKKKAIKDSGVVVEPKKKATRKRVDDFLQYTQDMTTTKAVPISQLAATAASSSEGSVNSALADIGFVVDAPELTAEELAAAKKIVKYQFTGESCFQIRIQHTGHKLFGGKRCHTNIITMNTSDGFSVDATIAVVFRMLLVALRTTDFGDASPGRIEAMPKQNVQEAVAAVKDRAIAAKEEMRRAQVLAPNDVIVIAKRQGSKKEDKYALTYWISGKNICVGKSNGTAAQKRERVEATFAHIVEKAGGNTRGEIKDYFGDKDEWGARLKELKEFVEKTSSV